MSCLEIETSSTFFFIEKFDKKSQSILQDRIENFDNYYPFIRNGCNLLYVYEWIKFFVSM